VVVMEGAGEALTRARHALRVSLETARATERRAAGLLETARACRAGLDVAGQLQSNARARVRRLERALIDLGIP